VPAKLLRVIMDRMYGRLLVNTNSPSWSYGSPVVLELSYCICDDKDEPFVANCTFKRYNHPPYVNSSVLLLERASAPIRLDAWVGIATTTCSVD
jgi:hypothetical protein